MGGFIQPWFRLIGITIFIPLGLTYLHFWNFLRTQQCVLVRANDTLRQVHCASSSAAGSYPISHRGNSLDYPQSSLPPSIAVLSTWLTSSLDASTKGGGSSGRRRRMTTNNSMQVGAVTWDGSHWHFATTSTEKQNLVKIMDFAPFLQEQQQQQQQQQEKEEVTSINKYGFRTNNDKKHSSSTYNTPRKPIPVTTGIFLVLNLGLFLLYWQYQVEPTIVSLNSQVYQDYGRAFSGNLAHFELWHLGFNMISLSTLGVVLEQRIYGSIPLLLFTLTFIPLTTLVVVALAKGRQKCQNNNSPFPNMVGFSGILFAWMVVATLKLQTSSCPIFFLPDICFDTYLIRGVSVSLGPLVQLLVAQVLLPRVSLMGHLAGILVGFAWHVGLLPPLEWIQPCISYTVLWMVGKLGIWSRCRSDNVVANSSSTTITTSLPPILRLLKYTRNTMLLHLFIMSYQNSPPWSMNSLIVSEGLLVWILSTLVRDGQQNKSMYNNSNNLGMIGRGYVVLALVVWITDSMTLGGWLVSHALWDMDGRVWMIMTARGILWCASIVSTCHLLTVLHEIPTCGSWKSVVWWVVEPCCSSTSRSVDMMKWSNNGVHLGSKPHSPTSTNVIETSHLV